MFVWLFITRNILMFAIRVLGIAAKRQLPLMVLLVIATNPEAAAQASGKSKIERLFDALMRSGKLPIEFNVSIYRTNPTGPGSYLGTIRVRNTMIKIADREEPALVLKANLSGLTPGPHAFHIHENPDCGPKEKDGVLIPGLAAGGHLYAQYLPSGTGGDATICKSYLGDLPDLAVDADGSSKEEIVAPRLALADLVNRSIMIHASKDITSAREACGIFR
jgi:Cu-Zn family superoxide dismutase